MDQSPPHDLTSGTLFLMLPDSFTKEQLRVQMTSEGVLRINEFPIPPYCDTNDVSPKFEDGVLSITFPKLINQANKPQEQDPITNPPEEPSMPQQHSDEPKSPTQAQVVNFSFFGHNQAQVQQETPKKKEPINDQKENNKIEEKVENDQKKVSIVNTLSDTKEVIKTYEGQKKQQGKMTQRSLRTKDDNDVDRLGFGCGDTRLKRGDLLLNMIVATLLILVLGVYVKNSLW